MMTVRVCVGLVGAVLVAMVAGCNGGSEAASAPSAGPPTLSEQATCLRAVPLLRQAADMIERFRSAGDVTTLDGDAYEDLAVDLASLEIVAAPSLRPHIATVASAAGDMNRLIDGRVASVTIESARVGGAGVAVAEACRQYAAR